KTAAATIQTDEDFNVILKALLLKDRRARCQVNVEFDTDIMDGFRIIQPVQLAVASQSNGNKDELVYGTRVGLLYFVHQFC
ncbi:hypothetical protein H0H92_001029, partial [Tricholoma furcatifolium]